LLDVLALCTWMDVIESKKLHNKVKNF